MPNDTTTDHPLQGLDGPVEIKVDEHGVAHIRAGSKGDLFFAQGFNAARDRLWQIDLWRKRGLGLLSQDFGPGYLEQDRGGRLFLYRGDMQPEWDAYAPDAEEICEAFVRGINAYVDEAIAGRAVMPPEFALAGTQPSHWQAADVVRIRTHTLTRNVLHEMMRSNLMGMADGKVDRLRTELNPPVEPDFDPSVPPGSLPPSVLNDFKLACGPVRFSDARLNAPLEEAERWTQVTPLGDVVLVAESEGSNNWVISGERTATGRPIMATDPHRTHALPSLRYVVHLTAPGIDVIGMGEPSVPGVMIGHNDAIAFALTIFGADQEDIMVYDLDPENPLRYRYKDGWAEMEVVTEVIPVKGAPDQTRELHYTCHGPVISRDGTRAYGIKSAWSEPGSAPYMASLGIMRAKDHDAYMQAVQGWGTPSVNHIYADLTGKIGWQTLGVTPIRPNWNGLLPMPGDGRFEWAGKLTVEQLPHTVNPERGYVATANEKRTPEDWDHETQAVTFEWTDGSRAARIHSVLDEDDAHTIEAACKLQNDVFSDPARRCKAVLAGLSFEGAAAEAAALLAGWDCFLTAESGAGLFYEYWMAKHLVPAIAREFGASDKAIGLVGTGAPQTVLAILEKPSEWLDGGAATRDRLLAESLASGWADCLTRFGADVAGWAWGDLHTLPLPHALAGAYPEAEGWSIPAMPLGGSGSTPNMAVYRAGDFQTFTGPSCRIVMDVGDWDNSVFVNLPGQSGDPRSPHYTDMKTDWLTGGYRPLLYTAAAVDAATEAVVTLTPAG
ncbi:penicillin acylase family protein [Pseudooceanicola nanhaiensis]|uniref:penicillin acylase family protein n=1 Tax=Pseudooceanicola nanhaiensis TaxID=375761 RepID=UPI001CD50C54|nr:penicillin acylase family protein [Pseudooceanicola nanhaiensis]MCA0919206.1 penicillin acylase family protein [Pseudooceanicola nanhaiensis]